jgi:hypothetical protein
MQTIKVTWNGQLAEIEVGERTLGDENNATRKATKIIANRNVQEATIDAMLVQEYLLLYSIKKAPFPLPPVCSEEEALSSLRKLGRKDGVRLFKAVEKENEVDAEGEF